MIPPEVADVRDILVDVWNVDEDYALIIAWRIYHVFHPETAGAHK